MANIDSADWHYGDDFPKGLPEENGGTHIGMYLNWIIDNNLFGETHLEGRKEEISSVKSKTLTGRDFLFECCDGKFWGEHLNEEGLAFTNFYYLNSDDPDDAYGQYLDDYLDTLGESFESLYEVPNTKANYEKMSRVIDERYRNWQSNEVLPQSNIKTATTVEDHPKIYSKRAILGFSLFFAAIFGGILLVQNLWSIDKKKEAYIVLAFSLVYTALTIFIVNIPEYPNTAITYGCNGVGGLILTEAFHKKHFPQEESYEKKKIWKALIIAFLIIIPFIFAVFSGL